MEQMYNPQEIINTANKMENSKNELAQLIQDLRATVDEMKKVYVSPAATAFARKFEEIEPQLNNYCKEIQGFSDTAKKHAQKVIDGEGTPK